MTFFLVDFLWHICYSLIDKCRILYVDVIFMVLTWKIKDIVKEDNYLKSTGIVRKVDELGRIVLPIELRRTLNIEEKDALEIYVDGESILLKKYQPACIFCGSAEDIKIYKSKNICAKWVD